MMGDMMALKTLTRNERLKNKANLVCKSMAAINGGAPP